MFMPPDKPFNNNNNINNNNNNKYMQGNKGTIGQKTLV